MKSKIVILFLILICSFDAYTQDTLKTVVLSDYYKKTISIIPTDSLSPISVKAFPNTSMAEILSRGNSIFIKNYGPGNIATITHRALSASHTGVLWNGINIQNNTLSTIDFSIIPSFIFSNSAWQGGIINNPSANPSAGGSLILSNNTTKSNYINLLLDGGSFLNFSQALNAKFSHKRHLLQIGAHNRYSKNNFPIINYMEMGLGSKFRQNAVQQSYGGQVDYAYYLLKHHKLQLSAWTGFTNRQVPAPIYVSETNAFQKDRFIRALIGYEFEKGKNSVYVKQAVFLEDLQFKDDNQPLSYMSFINWISDIQYKYTLSKRSQFFTSIQYSYQIGKNTTYFNREHSIFSTFSYMYNAPKIDFRIFIKPQYISSKYLNLSPQLYTKYKSKYIDIAIQAGRIFRAPSMNDRFWSNGGNPNLLPEDGITTDIQFYSKYHNTSVSATPYFNYLKNRIIWTPETIFWTPQNIDNTIGAGVETKFNQAFIINKVHKLEFQINYTYTYSKLIRPSQPNINGKRLIYTPEHLGGFLVAYSWKNLLISYHQRVISKRYTTFDNNEFLPVYTTADLAANYSLKFKKSEFQFFGNIQNLFNQYYEVVALRPMPGIHFQLGINFLINIQK